MRSRISDREFREPDLSKFFYTVVDENGKERQKSHMFEDDEEAALRALGPVGFAKWRQTISKFFRKKVASKKMPVSFFAEQGEQSLALLIKLTPGTTFFLTVDQEGDLIGASSTSEFQSALFTNKKEDLVLEWRVPKWNKKD